MVAKREKLRKDTNLVLVYHVERNIQNRKGPSAKMHENISNKTMNVQGNRELKLLFPCFPIST